MTRIHLLLLVLISSISLFSANGASKFQIGNDIINNLIKFVSKKVIAEANKHKDNLPSLNMDLSPVKFLPIILNLSNIKFEELVYREDELQINVDHSAKNMRIKLSKNLLLITYKIRSS